VFPVIEYPMKVDDEEEVLRRKMEEQRKLNKIKEEAERKRREEELARQRAKEMGVESEKDDGEAAAEEHGEEEGEEEDNESQDKKSVTEDYDKGQKEAPLKQVSNDDIRKELMETIDEATRECKDQEATNQILQAQIYKLRKLNNSHQEKDSQFNMSEVKYANTLARVHQIRLDLKLTHEKYQKMISDMREKLTEKLGKCQDLRATFMELKREVSRKAAYSKRNKGIPEDKILEWEKIEHEKSQELQKLRMEILKQKTNLAKQKKKMKDKEELAEGLHLIDFEQLKIENQSLNEKIEDRNEDLHKLKKKNTTTVQILKHTEEKLAHLKAENNVLSTTLEKLSR